MTAVRELQYLYNKYGKQQPALAFTSMLIHHLADPISMLKTLRAGLPSGSKLIIHTLDDPSMIGYPDTGGCLRRILVTGLLGDDRDRSQGRKLHQQLTQAGYVDIHLFVKPWILSNLDMYTRSQFFKMAFGFREQMCKESIRAGLITDAQGDTLDNLQKDLKQLQLQFQDPNYQYISFSFGAVATMP